MGLLGFLFTANADPLEVGDEAPVLTATAHDGSAVDLGSVYSSGPVLVYFYPKADTPGCTKQACSIRDDYEAIREAGLTVYGVSTDTVEAQKAFREKYRLPFTLLADPGRELVEAFGVPSMGQFAKRQAFLVKDGRIAWRDLSASTSRQAEDVLKVVADW